MQKYDITAMQKEKLLDDGFTRLPDALSPELLQRWRQLADSLEAQALDAHTGSEQIHGACVIDDPVGPRLMKQFWQFWDTHFEFTLNSYTNRKACW